MPVSSRPPSSTNSRLLGLRPSVATREPAGSPNAGTGAPQRRTAVPLRAGPASWLTKLAKMAYMSCLSVLVSVGPLRCERRKVGRIHGVPEPFLNCLDADPRIRSLDKVGLEQAAQILPVRMECGELRRLS